MCECGSRTVMLERQTEEAGNGGIYYWKNAIQMDRRYTDIIVSTEQKAKERIGLGLNVSLIGYLQTVGSPILKCEGLTTVLQ
jgi:hypothetical protein